MIKEFIKLMKLAFIMFVIIVMLILVYMFIPESKATELTYQKQYTSHLVQKGETITDYAHKYANGCRTVRQYIDEVQFMNHLNSADEIVSGKHLILPIYIIEEKK